MPKTTALNEQHRGGLWDEGRNERAERHLVPRRLGTDVSRDSRFAALSLGMRLTDTLYRVGELEDTDRQNMRIPGSAPQFQATPETKIGGGRGTTFQIYPCNSCIWGF